MNWEACCPRPQLRRASFLPLSDGWTLEGRPIRVPWPPQSALSGYSGRVGDVLHYETHFTLPEDFLPPKHRLLVHFGAVDQAAEVWLNGVPAVRHEGGYLPFSADITSALRKGENRLTVTATDTLSHKYPYGKQHKRPHGMWYTPVSGIWQAVWLEAVPERGAVASLRMTPDLAGVTLETDCGGVEYTVDIPLGNGRTVTVRSKEKSLRIDIPAPRLWSPEDPYLYRFTVTTETDRVESYFALRTVTREERGGRLRICLNGRPVFLHAVLDQGYFPDGLFLPSAPEAYERDILRMKELGFNTLRKHVKIEPEAFYYACDRLGMLVLQDMVNSGGYNWLLDTAIPNVLTKKRPDRLPGSPARRTFFEAHCLGTQRHLYNHPCIVGCTIFNEGWGQYDSDRIFRACKAEDLRLVRPTGERHTERAPLFPHPGPAAAPGRAGAPHQRVRGLLPADRGAYGGSEELRLRHGRHRRSSDGAYPGALPGHGAPLHPQRPERVRLHPAQRRGGGDQRALYL